MHKENKIGIININFVDFQMFPLEERYRFFEEHWGGKEMVISSGVYDCSQLPGIVACDQDRVWLGLLTYVTKNQEFEIISLDAIEEGNGIGSYLLNTLEAKAVEQSVRKISLITTNDNIRAIAFYQKRGYRLTEIYRNAVEKAREIKPSIPLVADNGISITDELVFVKYI